MREPETELFQTVEKAAAFDKLAAMLGSAKNWDGAAEWIDAIVEVIDATLEKNGDPLRISSSSDVPEWRRRAEALEVADVLDDPDPEPLAAEDIIYERDEAER